MLIEFEDRTPPRPLTLGDKGFVAFAALGSAIAIIGFGRTILKYLAAVARWAGLAS